MSLPDLKTIQIREALAFRLYSEAATSNVPTETASGCRDLWQAANEDTRREWRSEAENHITSLEQCGLGIRVSDTKELLKHLDWLVTVPPRPAYRLPSASPEIPTIQLPNPP